MPCVGFHCPDNEFLWRRIEDCEKCDDPVGNHGCLSIETVRWIWKIEFVDNADHYHNDAQSISVTETMRCLRRAYYNRREDYTETPKALKARAVGTDRHASREGANPNGCSEVEVSYDLSGDYTFRGTIDVATDDYIMDYKTCDNPRKTYDSDNAVQLSIYDAMADGPERRLLILQDGRRDEVVHEVHRVENALEVAVERAEKLIVALDANNPDLLEREGREMYFPFTKMNHCTRCPHVAICEEE